MTTNGMPVAVFGRSGGGDGEFHSPAGVAVDDKFIYVSDSGNNRIQIFNRDGVFLAKFGKTGIGQGEFNNPTGISAGQQGRLLVADTNNHRVQEFKVTPHPQEL
jgi:DNA-binding beta-propeller fold protein YncE